MARLTRDILGDATLAAIQSYSDMAGLLAAPEAFVQTATAISVHKSTGQRVSIELPMRRVVHEWGVNRANLAGLGSFRVDMAVYDPASEVDNFRLDALVEFKLWTDRNHVATDIRKLKKIIKSLKSLNGDHKNIHGFVVVCPQYHQGIAAMTSALSDFKERFPINFDRTCSIVSGNGIAYGVGVAVIDIDDCIDGNYG
ncbi:MULTISPECIES: hypothetical protein [Methylobacterium]|uniref:hypothetical protein n=1 Tax=Methylobacterium TaxID=407 RepID=UPI00272E44CD|nr:hypothetical protein [Methylobacterium sp.]